MTWTRGWYLCMECRMICEWRWSVSMDLDKRLVGFKEPQLHSVINGSPWRSRTTSKVKVPANWNHKSLNTFFFPLFWGESSDAAWRISSQQSRGVSWCRPQPRLGASVCSWLIWEWENLPRAKHPPPPTLPTFSYSRGGHFKPELQGRKHLCISKTRHSVQLKPHTEKRQIRTQALKGALICTPFKKACTFIPLRFFVVCLSALSRIQLSINLTHTEAALQWPAHFLVLWNFFSPFLKREWS